eukprot:Skav225195  [mRNA]  locus=scaffold3065:177265:180752:+ [translate_table: standard]
MVRPFLRYESNKLMTRFDVNAKCGDAYEGVAQVSMCKEPGEPYQLSGCFPGNCTVPSKKYSEAYNLTVYSLQRPKFSVTARCAFAPHIMGQAVPCKADQEPFTLRGCPLGECKAPETWMAAFADQAVFGDRFRYEANRRLGTFNVSARCADGYRGVAVVEAATGHGQKLEECLAHGQPYKLSGCEPEKCLEPSAAEKDARWRSSPGADEARISRSGQIPAPAIGV